MELNGGPTRAPEPDAPETPPEPTEEEAVALLEDKLGAETTNVIPLNG